MTTHPTIDHLRGLIAKATRGPVVLHKCAGTGGEHRIESRDEHGTVNDGWCIASDICGPDRDANGKLMEESWNRLPSLLDALEKAVAENNTAREWNKLRNAKRGTGVLQDWQKRLSKCRAATDAALEKMEGGNKSNG